MRSAVRDTMAPESLPGPSAVLVLGSSLLEHERQFHIDTEVADGAVVCKLDLVFRDPGSPNSIDTLLGLGNALSNGILEGPGGSRSDLDHLRY